MTEGPGGTAPPAPGSPQALELGCACPTLANASFRVGAHPEPLIDPTCPVHTRTTG